MANAYQESNSGGISFSTPIFSFGNTTPAVNSGLSFDLPLAAIQSFSNQALSFTSNNSSNNRGFLSNVINSVGSNVTSTADNAYNFQTSALSSLNGISSNMQSTVNKAVKSRASGGFCFITTAICENDQLADDCEELTLLRKFRDDVMLKDSTLKPMVDTYYLVAPEIVASINKREDRKSIYAMLRTIYLEPAMAAIRQGKSGLAVFIYEQMVNRAYQYVTP